MSARILAMPAAHLREAARRARPTPTSPRLDPAAIHFWRGASSRAYVHSIYPLYECPPLPDCTCVLVRRDPRGRPQALRVMRLERAAPSLNLAQVRQQSASLGASEVHVHLLTDDPTAALAVELDLKAATSHDLR